MCPRVCFRLFCVSVLCLLFLWLKRVDFFKRVERQEVLLEPWFGRNNVLALRIELMTDRF